MALAGVVAWAGAAEAQNPVCPQPDPTRPVYDVCVPGGRFVVIQMLSDLAVDHAVRGEASVIQREPRDIFRLVTTADTQEKNGALRDFLGNLDEVSLTRFDSATGLLRLYVAESQRAFESKLEIGGIESELSLVLPELVEGGYWRTPGVFQVAFWRGQRIRFRVSGAGPGVLDAEVECVSVSGNGIRLVTASDDVPDILVSLGSCQP